MIIQHLFCNHLSYLAVKSEVTNYTFLSFLADNNDETSYDVNDDDENALDAIHYNNETEISSTSNHDSAVDVDDDFSISLEDLANKYLIKIKESNRLTNQATQKIVDATSTLFDVTFSRLKKGLEQALTGVAGVNDIESIPGVPELFEEVCNPFNGMKSTWRQKNYLKHEPNFVVISRYLKAFYYRAK